MRMGMIGLSVFFACTVAAAQSGPFVFVFLNNNPNKPQMTKAQVDSLMAGHMANITRLAGEGKLVAAGPFQGGGGMFIFATGSTDSAWSWLRTDPGVRANRWILEVMPYTPVQGSVCKVQEPFQMTSYTFIRLALKDPKADMHGGSLRSSTARILEVLPPDSLVTEGLFPENGGSILVTRGEWDDSKFDLPAGIRERVILTKKKLWIARGAFCEK